jgi:hypothetical protein
MKKIQFVLTIVMMTITVTTYSQTKDKEVMIKSIFAALKNKDEQAYLKLFPTVATLKEVLQTSLKNGDKNLQDLMAGMTDSSLQAHIRRDFIGAIQDGEEKGINWSSADLTSYTADSVASNDEIMKTTTLEGKIYFKTQEKDFYIAYNEVIWFEGRGWYGVSLRNIGQMINGQEIDLDGIANSTAIANDTMAIADTVAIPVDVKPVKNTKVPVKNKPVRKKATTPARKPE